MTVDKNDILNSILESVSKIENIKSDDIPNIDLYMDQVTTFMEEHLEHTKRYDEDKILTKTMINNYAKNNLLPPPVKKKYSKEHLLVLIFIYYFKNILSIKDIEKVLSPLTENYFTKDSDLNLAEIYDEVWELRPERIESVKEDLKEMYQSTGDVFADAPEQDREVLQLFSFICTLSFDVYVKKQIIEKLIDQFPDKTK